MKRFREKWSCSCSCCCCSLWIRSTCCCSKYFSGRKLVEEKLLSSCLTHTHPNYLCCVYTKAICDEWWNSQTDNVKMRKKNLRSASSRRRKTKTTVTITTILAIRTYKLCLHIHTHINLHIHTPSTTHRMHVTKAATTKSANEMKTKTKICCVHHERGELLLLLVLLLRVGVTVGNMLPDKSIKLLLSVLFISKLKPATTTTK